MKLSRRTMLKAAFGATQLGLLERFGYIGTAHADSPVDGPTRLLTLYMQGGTRPQYFWWPLAPAMTAQYLPGLGYYGHVASTGPEGIIQPAGAGDGAYPALQVTRTWDPANPASMNGHSPFGYGWEQFGLWNQTAVLHGIDQGTNAHQSAYVAAMSGAAGSDYRAPTFPCVIANHMLSTPAGKDRPLPCVALSAEGMPQSRGLPGRAGAVLVPNIASMRGLFSANGKQNWWWSGLDARTARDVVSFAGQPLGSIGLTDLEAHSLAMAKTFKGRSTTGTDAYLEQLHDNYAAVSRTYATDITSALEAITPVEHLPAMPYLANAAGGGVFGYKLVENYYNTSLTEPIGMVLRLLKSNLATSIHLKLPVVGFDTHSGQPGHNYGAVHQRATFDVISRLLGEMKNTPDTSKPGRSLLDDTLVMIFSEFGRSWASGTSQGWSYPDDHHPFTSVTYVGGGVAGNRMIGSFQMPQARGVDVDIIEEDGQSSRRVPRASEVATTACRIFGMPFSKCFIPGGYGEVVGMRRT